MSETFPGYDQWKLASPPEADEDDDDDDDGDAAYDADKDDALTDEEA